MISAEWVVAVNQAVLSESAGLKGAVDTDKLHGALARIDNWQQYENTDNIFDIAALYALALAKAHAFSDGNKRTALVVMLTYLDLQGIALKPDCGLDDVMVAVASGQMDWRQLSHHLQTLVQDAP